MRRISACLVLLMVGLVAACGESGGRLEPTAPSLSLAPSVSSIVGQSTVQLGYPCEWYAQVHNGTAPFTWSWSQSDGGSGYVNQRTTTLESYVTSSNWDQWTLSVTVTDAQGRTASASKTINASWTATYCEF
ncbi:MAG TPA: hypothetical protein VHG28_21250 [Longimicrobiaceae bacterium]|nr:hypothetical protein [Longimicrobiaceae bacterium]